MQEESPEKDFDRNVGNKPALQEIYNPAGAGNAGTQLEIFLECSN